MTQYHGEAGTDGAIRQFPTTPMDGVRSKLFSQKGRGMASVGALVREYLLNAASIEHMANRNLAIEEELIPLGQIVGYYGTKQFIDGFSGKVFKVSRGYAGKLHIEWDDSIPDIDSVVIPGDAATDAPSEEGPEHPEIEAARAALYKELDNATA